MLSIIIPSRNEKCLRDTLVDIRSHIELGTEVLVGLDGWMPDFLGQFSFTDDGYLFYGGFVHCFYNKEAIGQRAMQNKLASIAKGEFIMKLDAHCSLSQGFDTEILKSIDEKMLMMPVFCGLDVENWQVIPKPRQVCGRFGKDFVFRWWSEYEEIAKEENDLVENLAVHGSCFIVSKEKYFKWNLCDESWGSWGRQATEVSIKTWLNGGRVVTNRNCYYGHMFRGEKDFPYERDMEQIKATEQKCIELSQQKGFKELLEKFKPIPEWH